MVEYYLRIFAFQNLAICFRYVIGGTFFATLLSFVFLECKLVINLHLGRTCHGVKLPHYIFQFA